MAGYDDENDVWGDEADLEEGYEPDWDDEDEEEWDSEEEEDWGEEDDYGSDYDSDDEE